MSNRAATGMRVDVFTLGARARKICGGVVDAYGVVDAPVLASEPLASGEYEVVFHIGEYFRGRAGVDARSPHLDTGALPLRDVGRARLRLAGARDSARVRA